MQDLNTTAAQNRCMNHSFTIVAHRGGKGHGFENSMEAIDACLAHQPDMIEVDVRMTRDKEFVLFHDAVLDRLTNWSGLVNTKTLKTLKNVRLKNGARIPTVDDLFHRVKKQGAIKLILDIKDLNTGIFDYEKLIKKIRKHGLEKRVLLLCLNYHLLRRIASDYPEFEYCCFGLLPQRKVLLRAQKIGARYVGALMLTKQFIRKAHKKNLKVMSLGTENKKKLGWFMEYGVDVISTGKPEVLRELSACHARHQTVLQRLMCWMRKKAEGIRNAEDRK